MIQLVPQMRVLVAALPALPIGQVALVGEPGASQALFGGGQNHRAQRAGIVGADGLGVKVHQWLRVAVVAAIPAQERTTA